MKANENTSSALAALAVVLFAGTALMSGCQVQVAGQTLPSAYYLTDDIQYFPKGPEMKVSQEAAAIKAYNSEREKR